MTQTNGIKRSVTINWPAEYHPTLDITPKCVEISAILRGSPSGAFPAVIISEDPDTLSVRFDHEVRMSSAQIRVVAPPGTSMNVADGPAGSIVLSLGDNDPEQKCQLVADSTSDAAGGGSAGVKTKFVCRDSGCSKKKGRHSKQEFLCRLYQAPAGTQAGASPGPDWSVAPDPLPDDFAGELHCFCIDTTPGGSGG